MFQSSNIYETFSPFYILLKLLGIVPFQLNLKSGKVSVKWQDVLWIFFYWIFFVALIVLNITFGKRKSAENSTILQNGCHFLLIFHLTSSFFIQFVNFFNRKKIGKFFKILHDFDEMVRQFSRH